MPKTPTTHTDEHGRVCTKCKQYKSWDEFGRSGTKKNGKMSTCKMCINERWKKIKYRKPKEKMIGDHKRNKGRPPGKSQEHYPLPYKYGEIPPPPKMYFHKPKKEYWETSSIQKTSVGTASFVKFGKWIGGK